MYLIPRQPDTIQHIIIQLPQDDVRFTVHFGTNTTLRESSGAQVLLESPQW